MLNIKTACIALCLLVSVSSCGDSATNTGTENAATPDSAGDIPAPSNNAVDMSKTSVDSLRNTTDIKADTTGTIKK